MEKCYSTNGEDFNYTDVGEVLDAMDNDGNLVEGAVYYEHDSEVVRFTHYLNAARLLEYAEEQLCDEVGEAGEDAFLVGVDATEQLDSLLSAWVAKHLKGQYWRCVGKRREIKVTASDVAEHAA